MAKVYSVKIRFWHEGTDPSVVLEPERLEEPEGFAVSINDKPYRAPTMTAWEVNAWLRDNGMFLKKVTLGERVTRPAWKGQYTLAYGVAS